MARFPRQFRRSTQPPTVPVRAVSMQVLQQYDQSKLLELYEELLQAQIDLMRNISSGLNEVETPGVGRVQYASVDDMYIALRLVESQITQIGELLGFGGYRRRPIHPEAIE